MRSIAVTIMSFGAIAMAFGAVTVVLLVLAKANAHTGLATFTTTGMLALVAGAAMLIVGYLMSRMGRRGDGRTAETTRY